MGAAYSHEQIDLTVEQEVSSLLSLLEQGLDYAHQGDYAEAVTYFALARTQLQPGKAAQAQLTATLEAFIHCYVHYWQAQQDLHEASKRFAEADARQQASMAALEQLLLTMEEEEQAETLHPPRTSQNVAQRSRLQLVSENTHTHHALPPVREGNGPPPLYVTCFGHFEVQRFGQPVALCSNRNGQTILRYLIAQPQHRATMDTLMAVLWPEEMAEEALHKLRVAISALRRSLNSTYVPEAGGGYILCKNQVYELNPAVALESDVDAFLTLYQAGQQATTAVAMRSYEQACQLYIGPFLNEDLYADWAFLHREQLCQVYLTMCIALADYSLQIGHYEDAIRWANAILKENHCDEEAHRQLMRAYAAQGRRSEALRQYQRCQRVLEEELSIQPMSETTNLFYSILNGTGEHDTSPPRR